MANLVHEILVCLLKQSLTKAKSNHMNKLTCPHCKTPFEVDEQGYSSLIKQVRDEQFEKELDRVELAAIKKKMLQ